MTYDYQSLPTLPHPVCFAWRPRAFRSTIANAGRTLSQHGRRESRGSGRRGARELAHVLAVSPKQQANGNTAKAEKLAAAMVGRTRAGDPLEPIKEEPIPGIEAKPGQKGNRTGLHSIKTRRAAAVPLALTCAA